MHVYPLESSAAHSGDKESLDDVFLCCEVFLAYCLVIGKYTYFSVWFYFKSSQ